MPDEAAVIEAPPAAQPIVPEDTPSLEDRGFGNLAEAFDKAFPSTAVKPEEAAQKKEAPAPPPPPEAVEAAPTPAPEPVVVVKSTSDLPDLPDFLFAEKDKPKAEEIKPPPGDPDLPVPTGEESAGVKQLRAAYDALKIQSKAKEQEFMSKIEALQASPAEGSAQATIGQLQKQVEELSGIVERKAIEEHPRVKAQFSARRNQLVQDAHQMLADGQIDPVRWDRAMALTGPERVQALDAIYEEMPKSLQNELGGATREIRSLDSAKERFLADRKAAQEYLNSQDVLQQQAAQQEHEKNTIQMMGAAKQELVDAYGIEVFKRSDDPKHAKWNEDIDRMESEAKKILLEVTDQGVMARVAYLAPAAIRYRGLYHLMRDKYLAEKSKNDATKEAEPTLSSNGPVSTAPEDDKLSFADAAARMAFSQI